MANVKQRIIKKYSNRRLYDTEESRYITQDKIKEYVTSGVTFRVVSAKSGEDITRSVLLHVILDEEIMGVPLFSEEALRSIILFSGSGVRSSLSGFLEQMLPMLQQNQFSDAFNFPPMPGGGDRIQEQAASLQGMLLGNAFQEYLNRSMKMVGEFNREIASSTAKMMQMPGGAPDKPKPRGKGKKKVGG